MKKLWITVCLVSILAFLAISWQHNVKRTAYIAKSNFILSRAWAIKRSDSDEQQILAAQKYGEAHVANMDWQYDSLKMGTVIVAIVALIVAQARREQAS